MNFTLTQLNATRNVNFKNALIIKICALCCFAFVLNISANTQPGNTSIIDSCNTYTGIFFYANCGGINYYFIELEDGRIFDPYFADAPGFYPEEGQQIQFDFEIKTDVTTPCDISESPITITCFEEIEQNDDCPTSDPLNRRWIQEIIDIADGCAFNEIRQFSYEGSTYFYTTPEQTGYFYCNNGVSNDNPVYYYDCFGNIICFGGIGPPCDLPDLVSASNDNYTTIWSYNDNTIGNCNTYTGTFFYANCGGINYYFIELEDGRIFDPYIANDPAYYPEEGQQIQFDFEIKTDVTTPCDISESPITITCFEEIEPDVTCPEGDPLEWGWIQAIIANSRGCSTNEIRQFNYEGSTYFYTAYDDTGFFCNPGISDDHAEVYFDCNGNVICLRGFAPICESPIIAGRNNYTTIWNYNNHFPKKFKVRACPDQWHHSIVAFKGPDGAICNPVEQEIGIDPITNEPVISNFKLEDNCTIFFTITGEGIFTYRANISESSTEIREWIFEIEFYDSCDPVSPSIAYDICPGGSITIDSELTIPPLGQQPPAGQQNCNNLIRTIEPNDETVTISGNAFVLSPDTVTEYRIISNYGPADSGDECVEGQTINQKIRIGVLDTCITNLTIDYYFPEPGEYTLEGCEGDVFIIKADYFRRGFTSYGPPFSVDVINSIEHISPGIIELTLNNESQIGFQGTTSPYEKETGRWLFNLALKDDCETSSETCPDGDPLEWNWLQNIINRNDLYAQCAIGYIQQFEYNGHTYIKTRSANNPTNNPSILCPSDFPEEIYDCQGNFICQISIQMTDRCLPGDFDYDIVFNAPVIWERTFVADEPACYFPLDEGTCDDRSLRYYYDAEAGSCKSFIYNGCNGNANNHETYSECINACNAVVSCPEGDPLQWDWIQNIINQWDHCSLGSISLQEYSDGNSYIFIYPGNASPHTGNGPPPAPCLSGNPIYRTFTCQGTLLCTFEPVHYPPCTVGDLGELVNTTNIWTRENASNEAACELPLVEGTCDEFIPRYYYKAEEGNCQTFIYTGCGGNANNYETYSDCMNACNGTISCPEGDPLEWDWIQEIIANSDGCATGEIRQFERNGNYYFEAKIGPPCLNYDPLYNRFYDCNGNLICIVGLFPPGFPPICNSDFFEGTQNHTTIWTYEYDCTDPFESSIVQNAMLDECTDAIYTFDHEGDPYIYIKQRCDYIDVLYDCQTKEICGINTSGVSSFSCPSLIESVQPLLTNENVIWTNDCTYEITGTVYYSENCGLYIGCCLDSQFQIASLPEDIELVVGQIVEFSYKPATDEICLPLGQPVEITCIRKIADDCGCPPPSKPPALVCGVDGNTYDSDCLANCYANGVAYQGECRVCNSDNPLEEDWIKDLIINGEGCTVYEISQFEYDGITHFAVSPNAACVSDFWVSYYDCFGNLVCTAQIFGEACDPAISDADNSATTIWTYNQAACQNPLETDFVQDWLNGDCAAEAIYSFEFEGETYIYIEPNPYCDIFIDDYGGWDFLYNCNLGIACDAFEFDYYINYYGFSCFNISELFFESVLISDNLIWTKPCTYELSGEVINIGDYIPAEYLYDEDCDLVINIPGIGQVVSPLSLPEGFTLTEGQTVEFTYLNTYAYQEGACSDVQPVEIICIREAGDNQNMMDRIECPKDHTTSVCAPVNIPVSMDLQDFNTTDDSNYMNSMSMQMEEQTDIQKYFTTTTRMYTISDESGNQKTCETKHHIANQFLQMPEVSEPGTICEEDLWSYVKIGTDQYKIYSDQNGSKGEIMSTCNTPNLICSTANFGVDTKVPNQYNFWATTYFEFPDGSICESEAMPFYVDVQAKPTASLSAQNKTMNIGEGMSLMDVVAENKSGYWSGENIIYLMTATGENIAYFSANEAGVYKLYYTVSNEKCKRSYLMIVEVASAGKAAATQASYKNMNTVFNIYPNPSTNKVFIDLPDGDIYQINLLDISGKIMKEMKTKADRTTVEMDVSDLPKGIYLVALKNETDSNIQKLIIE